MKPITTLAIAPLVLLLFPACGSGSGASGSPSPAHSGSTESSDAGLTIGPNGPFATAPIYTSRTIVTMDPFDVQPGGEVYICQTLPNPFGKDVDIVQAQSQMTPGSHHLFIFAVDPAADAGGSELEPCSGLEFHELVYGSQRPTSVTTYPPGVGQFLGGGKGLRLQAHYLNTGTETIHAQVQTTFDVATEPVLAHAAWMILNDNMVNVAPGSSSASSSLALIPEIGDVKLILAESHMHRHGVHFTSSLGDGTPIYETDQWNDPAPRNFDSPGFPVASGSTINWSCDYRNDTGSPLTFGESAADNEMCIFGGLYYPAPSGRGVFGQTSAGTMMFTDTLFP